jgi:hypothetical protein
MPFLKSCVLFVALIACSGISQSSCWEGIWDPSSGNSIALHQSGSYVRGNWSGLTSPNQWVDLLGRDPMISLYPAASDGQLTGTVLGNYLNSTWSRKFNTETKHGSFSFKMYDDCDSFTGGFEENGYWFHGWPGTGRKRS